MGPVQACSVLVLRVVTCTRTKRMAGDGPGDDSMTEPDADTRRRRQCRCRRVRRSVVVRPRVEAGGRGTITSLEGIPALSLDAISSVAYGPEAMLVVLATAGTGALAKIEPITVAIVVLLVILVLSYRQVIDAYPNGGGAYAVSKDNLGRRASHLAGASLIIDYVLTVAVSIAAGVAALVSAFPSLSSESLPIGLGILARSHRAQPSGHRHERPCVAGPDRRVHRRDLRGHRRPGSYGATRRPTPPCPPISCRRPRPRWASCSSSRRSRPGAAPSPGSRPSPTTCPPSGTRRVQRAQRTEVMLGGVLGTMLLGLSVLTVRFHIAPSAHQTVLSQITSASVGRGGVYYVVDLSTTVILAIAANTSFGGLPVLASLLAGDNLLPHVFGLRADRQVYRYGVVVLAVLAGGLLVAVDANTNSLIPLYAIGVFTGFTLSQTGLVRHWHSLRPPGWQRRAALNSLGAVMTAVATVIFVVTKFVAGAWVVVITIPLLILLFSRISRYYSDVGAELRLGSIPAKPTAEKSVVIVMVAVGVSLMTEAAVAAGPLPGRRGDRRQRPVRRRSG